MQIVLVLTSRCNASCTHCMTSCGPTQTDSLRRDEIFRLMREARDIQDGTDLRFDVTGGEPFLDFELLVDVVAFATNLGGSSTCVTNAYWARSEETARQRLGALREAGISALSVSVSRFHGAYVPLERAERALRVARDLGIATALKGAVTRSDLKEGATLNEWRKQLRADRVDIFPVIPPLRVGMTLKDEEYYREPGIPTQVCPNAVVCIEPDGRAFSCCGPTSGSDFLALGSIHESGLAEIAQRFRTGTRQRILREEGPQAFAHAARAIGLGARLRDEYAGPCDLCVHVATDPQLRQIADACKPDSKP